MRGTDETSGALFSYVGLDERVPAGHPLRKIRQIVNDALASLDAEFDALYTKEGRPSVAPERLIRARLLQILFSILGWEEFVPERIELLKRCAGVGFGDVVGVGACGLPCPRHDLGLTKHGVELVYAGNLDLAGGHAADRARPGAVL